MVKVKGTVHFEPFPFSYLIVSYATRTSFVNFEKLVKKVDYLPDEAHKS